MGRATLFARTIYSNAGRRTIGPGPYAPAGRHKSSLHDILNLTRLQTRRLQKGMNMSDLELEDDKRPRITASEPIKLTAVLIYVLLSLTLSGYAAADDPGTRYEVPIATQRDANFNRVIPAGASLTAATTTAAARNRAPGSIGTVANTISIIKSGSGNTIILNAEQTNSRTLVAANSLNGKLQFD